MGKQARTKKRLVSLVRDSLMAKIPSHRQEKWDLCFLSNAPCLTFDFHAYWVEGVAVLVALALLVVQ